MFIHVVPVTRSKWKAPREIIFSAYIKGPRTGVRARGRAEGDLVRATSPEEEEEVAAPFHLSLVNWEEMSGYCPSTNKGQLRVVGSLMHPK